MNWKYNNKKRFLIKKAYSKNKKINFNNDNQLFNIKCPR